MIDRYHAELEALVERACTAAVERAYKCPGASVCCNPSWCKTASKCMRLEDERMRPKPVAWRYWKDKFQCWEYSDVPLEYPAVPAGTKMQALYLGPNVALSR